MAKSIADLVIKIGADTKDMEAGLSSAQVKLQKLSEGAKKAGIGLMAVGTAITGLGIAAVKSYAETGDALSKMATRTGISAQALSELKYAAQMSGSSIEDLETSVKRMQMFMVDATEGSALATDTLDKLGLKLTDLQGLNQEDQFLKLSYALADVDDAGQRASLAFDLFGKSGTDLLPMFADGSAALAGLRQEANDLGVTMDDVSANKAAELGDSIEDLKFTFDGMKVQIGEALAPAVINLANSLTEQLKPAIAWLSEHPEATEAFVKFGLAFIGVGGLLLIIPQVVRAFKSIKVAIMEINAAMVFLQALTGVGLVKALVGVAAAGAIIFGMNKVVEANTEDIPGFADGGIVTKPTLAMVGEAGPEAITPLGQGFGNTVNVTVQGSVIAEHDLAQSIRSALLQDKSRNANLGLA